jgi:hypothetical protein
MLPSAFACRQVVRFTMVDLLSLLTGIFVLPVSGFKFFATDLLTLSVSSFSYNLNIAI